MSIVVKIIYFFLMLAFSLFFGTLIFGDFLFCHYLFYYCVILLLLKSNLGGKVRKVKKGGIA
jgi:hypothetical protein